MSGIVKPGMTGGCQCGKVRYRLSTVPTGAHICHCRMCQRAVGGLYAALAVIDPDDIEWIGARPAVFNSSQNVERGFCANCGTPLTYHYLGNRRLNFTIASLDDPTTVKPEVQIGIESRMPWHSDIHSLPEHSTDAVMDEEKSAGMGANLQYSAD